MVAKSQLSSNLGAEDKRPERQTPRRESTHHALRFEGVKGEPAARRRVDLETDNNRLLLALDHMSQGLCMFGPDACLIVANRRYAEMYGLSPHHVAPGTSFRTIVEARIAAGAYAGRDPDAYYAERLSAVREREESVKFQTLPDGRVILISHRPMADGGWVATHEDITEQRRFEEKIAHMAHHDALTDLPNRSLLRERLCAVLSESAGEEMTGVLMIDLDRFKEVNDTLGHAIGDKLLQAVADRLKGVIRKTDTVARMGGDEFAIIQTGLDSISQAEALADRLVDSLSRPFSIDDHRLVIGASVGVAICPMHGNDRELLLRNADLALYEAKSTGRGTYIVFASGMDHKAHDRRRKEVELREALVNDQFELHYQPMVDLKTNEIIGVEALVRWRHPQRGLLQPASFIPIAEATGLILPLGDWVIRQACETVAQWPGALALAINLSGSQLKSKTLMTTVTEALAASGLDVARLELEITESVLVDSTDRVLETLQRLGDLGVKIVLDDFGTGYSSLRYLQSFPFSKIKIDRSFVSELPASASSLAIVRAISAMAKGLGIKTTVEGVETTEQRELMRAEGCSEMQGFLISRPEPASVIEAQYLRKAMDRKPSVVEAA